MATLVRKILNQSLVTENFRATSAGPRYAIAWGRNRSQQIFLFCVYLVMRSPSFTSDSTINDMSALSSMLDNWDTGRVNGGLRMRVTLTETILGV